jgi:hypothetical protein
VTSSGCCKRRRSRVCKVVSRRDLAARGGPIHLGVLALDRGSALDSGMVSEFSTRSLTAVNCSVIQTRTLASSASRRH